MLVPAPARFGQENDGITSYQAWRWGSRISPKSYLACITFGIALVVWAVARGKTDLLQ